MAARKKSTMSAEQKWGLFYFALFAIFIVVGILVKRIWGHPEFMMMFHLPAAVFLVFAGKNVSAEMRRNYLKQSLWEKL